jgi:hypothetical protein
VLIVPVLEERLVVRTELILKEELRITRKSPHRARRHARAAAGRGGP